MPRQHRHHARSERDVRHGRCVGIAIAVIYCIDGQQDCRAFIGIEAWDTDGPGRGGGGEVEQFVVKNLVSEAGGIQLHHPGTRKRS
ncbi:hypothetical protein D3C80_1981040 [compost metagenome]